MTNPGLPSSDIADRLPFCPRCTYPFTGLPEAHQCPECGLTYDRDCHIWFVDRNRKKWERVAQIILGVLVLLNGIMFTGFGRRAPAWGTFMFWVGATNCIVGLLCIATSFRTSAATRLFLALWSDGIWYSMFNLKSRFIPWKRIRSADDGFVGWGIAFTIHLRPRGRVLIRKELRGSMDTRSVIAQINERAQFASN